MNNLAKFHKNVRSDGRRRAIFANGRVFHWTNVGAFGLIFITSNYVPGTPDQEKMVG